MEISVITRAYYSSDTIIRKNGWLLQVMEITTVPPRSGQMVTDTAGRNGQIKTSVRVALCTITGDKDNVKVYVDGEKTAENKTSAPLTGSNQDIYVGVTNWDGEFTGSADDIKVYNKTLTEGEVYQLYDDSSAESLLEKNGIEATKSLNMVVGREENIEVTMPVVVKEANPSVAYVTDNKDIATVDETGKVTATGAGTTKITTKVTLGSTTKEAVTEVMVKSGLEENLKATYSFEDNLTNSITDKDATAVTTKLAAYSKDVDIRRR